MGDRAVAGPASKTSSLIAGNFAFTIEDVVKLEDNRQRTKEMLSFLNWDVADILLCRPPFRFLFDLITRIMTHTNYRPNLYDGDFM